VDAETGELPADWAQFLDVVQGERDAKALGVACYIRECKAEADAVDAERERLAIRTARLSGKAQRMREYLAAFVPAGEKLKNASVSIGWRKSTAVEVEAPVESLPAAYVRIVPETRAPDKKAIGDALKSGTAIDGCKLVERHSIQVK